MFAGLQCGSVQTGWPMSLLHRIRRNPVAFKIAKSVHNLVVPAAWAALDAGESILGKRDPLTPPRRLMNVGSNSILRNDFNAIGLELFQYLRDIGGLRPDDKSRAFDPTSAPSSSCTQLSTERSRLKRARSMRSHSMKLM